MSSVLYEKLADLGFGFSLPQNLVEDCRVSLGAANALDTVLDQPEGAFPWTHGELLDGIRSNNTEGMPARIAEYAMRFANWSDKKRNAHMESHEIIAKSASQKPHTETAPELFDLLQEEGRALGRLAHVYHSDERAKRFNDMLSNGGTCTMVLDTICDLHEDYKNGLIGVEPKLKNRLELARLVRPIAQETWNSIPHKDAIFVVGTAIAGMKIVWGLAHATEKDTDPRLQTFASSPAPA